MSALIINKLSNYNKRIYINLFNHLNVVKHILFVEILFATKQYFSRCTVFIVMKAFFLFLL